MQSAIVEEKQKHFINQVYKAIVDGKSAQEQDVSLVRTYMQAPEVDGYVRVKGTFANGTFLNVRITGFDGYDLLGEPVKWSR